jgi:hypothetical protein
MSVRECCGSRAEDGHAVWCPLYVSRGVADDLRGARSPEHPPAWHQWRLDRTVRSYWRIAIFIAVVMVLGSIAEWLQ